MNILEIMLLNDVNPAAIDNTVESKRILLQDIGARF
jgi:hypothetical protein